MCIAILNTKGTTLKKQLLNNCWDNNGDGAGILYIDNDSKLQTFKTLDSFDEFYKNYIHIKQTYGKRRNMLLHFRISTHGVINEENCHPFITDDNVGFIHNGMIHDVPDSIQYSDTNMLNRTLLQKLKPGFDQDDDVLEFLESFIGAGNKLVFLNKNDEWSIVNEKAGHWNLECWFSNDSYKQVNDWYDFGGVRKKKAKGSRVGFMPQYSYQDFYTDYNDGYGTALEESKPTCECGFELLTVNEMNRGTCDFCHDHTMTLLDSSKPKAKDVDMTCDNCLWRPVSKEDYRPEWDAHVCEHCMGVIDNTTLGA